MGTYVALLRGINVGGRHRLAMHELRQLLAQHGCIDVQTYIQSGNVVFRSASADAACLPAQLRAAISRSRGFAPSVLVLTLGDLERAAHANPYDEATADPASVHLFFLAERPKNPDVAALDQLRASTERFTLTRKVFYLHAPGGIGRSRLAQGAERLLGVDATARNWRTVTTLLRMAQALG